MTLEDALGVEDMNETTQHQCEGCAYESDTLTLTSWKHNDTASQEGWCGDMGQVHRGAYCPECMESISRIRKAGS
jgi:hypothetical protein